MTDESIPEPDTVEHRHLGRRSILRGGAVLGAAAATTALRPGPVHAAAGPAATAGRPPRSRLLGSGRFPIGMWWPPPPDFTTRARYREIAADGFTFVTAGDGVADMPLNATMLDAADHAGLLALPQDSRVSDFPADSLAQRRAVMADYDHHRSFAGFYLYDEPSVPAFTGLAAIEEALRSVGNGAFVPYVNLLPNYATTGQLGAPDYDSYLATYLQTVPAPFISYDFYPFPDDGSTAPGYFANWASVRAACLQADIPSWIFIQAMDFPGRRRPTEAEIRWQINASLAYGCTGIQYFCYWSPGGTFGAGLLTRDGERTPLYDAAARINRHYLRQVGAQLLPLVSESVVHANQSPLPAGAAGFEPNDLITAVDGAPVIVGTFRRRRGHDRARWVLVTNLSYRDTAAASVTFGQAVGAVQAFDPCRDRYRPIHLGRGRKQATAELAAGDARLYRVHSR